MNKNAIVEIAQFKLVAGVSEKDFLQEAEVVQNNFLEKQRGYGYIDRELLKDKDGQWVDILHWNSMEEAHKAAEVMMSDPATQDFMQKIDPSSVKMLHLEVVKKY
ncbi:MAG: hypothetical protein HY432_02420 [Candidatus Liptonbacteria bacterium]|nr:hypothetical protein [Candidatus Liptonbacteria bacterium]